MRFSISSFFTLVVAASTVLAQPAKRAPLSINPPPDQNQRVDLTALPPVDVTPVTNAKRFVQGLPPLNPVKLRPHRGGPHEDGSYPHGTRVGSAPRAETSPSPQTNVKCNILVKAGGSTLGYISPVFNDYGEFGPLQASQDGALAVSFSNSGSASGPVDMVITNNVDTVNSFPYLSAASAFLSFGSDLGHANFHYVYVTGNSGSTGSGATPSSSTGNSFVTRSGLSTTSETAIWTYDPTTQDIRVVWTNTDGSSVPTKLIYFANGNGNTLAATGDIVAFQGTFRCTDTCPEVTFTCVPPA